MNSNWEKIQKNKDLEIATLISKLAKKDNEFLSFKSEFEKNKQEVSSLKNKLENKDTQHDAKIKGNFSRISIFNSHWTMFISQIIYARNFDKM